jgi:NADH:ubiquinone oxidoreductase subunit E
MSVMSELWMDVQDMLERGESWQNVADTLNVPVSWVEEVAREIAEFENE